MSSEVESVRLTDQLGGDPIYDTALLFVRSREKFITADLQRQFMIGYNRASRLIGAMIERGDAEEVNDTANCRIYWVARKVDA